MNAELAQPLRVAAAVDAFSGPPLGQGSLSISSFQVWKKEKLVEFVFELIILSVGLKDKTKV